MDKQELRNWVSKQHQVIVRRLSLSDSSTCNHKGCKGRDIYSVFVGEYPKLSNLICGCCGKHLSQFIDMAISVGKKEIAKDLRERTISEKKKAKQLLEQ